jgi:hypothetical protein
LEIGLEEVDLGWADNPIKKFAAAAADALPWDPLNSLANSSSLLAHEKGKTNVGAI